MFYVLDEIFDAENEVFIPTIWFVINGNSRQIDHLDRVRFRKMVHDYEQARALDVPLTSILQEIKKSYQLTVDGLLSVAIDSVCRLERLFALLNEYRRVYLL